MNIRIESYYDGFAIFIDDVQICHIDQTDCQEELVKAFKIANPLAIVEYEEVY